MCDFGISAIITTVSTVVSTVISSVAEAEAARAQNERNRQAQKSMADAHARKMSALARRELQAQQNASLEKDEQQRAERVAVAESETISSAANIKGRSAARLTDAIRRKRLDGIAAADQNLSQLRTESQFEAEAVHAQFMNQNNSLEWADPGAAIAGAVVGGLGSVAGGLSSTLGTGDDAASGFSHIKGLFGGSKGGAGGGSGGSSGGGGGGGFTVKGGPKGSTYTEH